MIQRLMLLLVVHLVVPLAGTVSAAEPPRQVVLIQGTRLQGMHWRGEPWEAGRGCIEGRGAWSYLLADLQLGEGDFQVEAQLTLEEAEGSEAEFLLGPSRFGFADAKERTAPYYTGPLLHGGKEKRTVLKKSPRRVAEGQRFTFLVHREGTTIRFTLDGVEVASVEAGAGAVGEFGLHAARARVQVHRLSASGALVDPPRYTARDVAGIQDEIDRAIDRGVLWLLRHQQRDGSWAYREGQYRGGITALCTYTLLKSGVPPEHLAVRRALRYLERSDPQETYTIACHLMALEATHDPRHHPRMEELRDRLLGWQRGGWSYPWTHGGGGWVQRMNRVDLSNTQFAALGLRAVFRAGLKVPRKAWEDLIRDTRQHQEERRTVPGARLGPGETGTREMEAAGFFYVGPHAGYARSATTASMTCAGVGILAIAREGLGESLGNRLAARVEESIQAGLNWLVHNWNLEENHGGGGWHRYYLYGLERVGSLLGLEYLGSHHWYYEGAQVFLRQQGDQGNWGDQPDTCYAILFLRRATGQATGGDPEVSLGVYVCEDEASDVWMRGLGQSPMALWITRIRSLGPEEPSGLGGVAGEPPRIVRVDYLVNGHRVLSVPGDPSRPWRQETFRVEHHFQRPGTYRITAAVHAVDPEAPPSATEPTILLTSAGFEARVQVIAGHWALRAAEDPFRNLVGPSQVVAKASSQHGNGNGPERAVDGLQSTRWISSKSDPTPSFTLQLRRPVKANTLVLSQGDAIEARRDELDLILELELRLNGKKDPYLLQAGPGLLRPVAFHLPRVETIKQLELRVTGRRPGSRQTGRIGLAEVTLQKDAVLPPVVTRDLDARVSLTCPTPEALIYYTLDGTDPSHREARLHGEPFTWELPALLHALALDPISGDASRLSTAYLPAFQEGGILIWPRPWRILGDADELRPSGVGYFAIDGDPTTSWESSSDPFPHELQLDLGETLVLSGITYLPRQGDVRGHIKEYAVHVSGRPDRWDAPVAQGEFASSNELQVVRFAAPVTGRYLRLVALSPRAEGGLLATCAELDVLARERR